MRSQKRITDGDEADVWKVKTAEDAVVVHAGPPWRSGAELAWVHEVASFSAHEITEVVVPVPAKDGRTFAHVDDRLVTVFPFVAGDTLRCDDLDELRDAGRMLARIHRVLLAFEGSARPLPLTDHPQPRAGEEEPAEFADPVLDDWWTRAATRRWTAGIVHGDYYRRNLLCRKGRIVGVIDWHEARHAPLMLEVAFATFEMAHDHKLRFLRDRAEVFLDAYREDSPVPRDEFVDLVPLMRIGLRDNARYAIDAARHGSEDDPKYVALQAKAFAALRDVTGM